MIVKTQIGSFIEFTYLLAHLPAFGCPMSSSEIRLRVFYPTNSSGSANNCCSRMIYSVTYKLW